MTIGTISTKVAGGRTCGFSGDGGQAGNAEIGASVGQFAFDIAGNFYFTDTNNNRVRRIDVATGIIHTIAGIGTAGYSGDGGKATTAKLNGPTGLAVNSRGTVYIISSASSGQVIRQVGPQGYMTFGNQDKGVASAAQLVRVSNTGNSAMTLTNAEIVGANKGDFKIDDTTTTCILTQGTELSSGQSCRIGVIFTPGAVGARAATLTLLDNTANGADSVISHRERNIVDCDFQNHRAGKRSILEVGNGSDLQRKRYVVIGSATDGHGAIQSRWDEPWNCGHPFRHRNGVDQCDRSDDGEPHVIRYLQRGRKLRSSGPDQRLDHGKGGGDGEVH